MSCSGQLKREFHNCINIRFVGENKLKFDNSGSRKKFDKNLLKNCLLHVLSGILHSITVPFFPAWVRNVSFG